MSGPTVEDSLYDAYENYTHASRRDGIKEKEIMTFDQWLRVREENE